MSLVWGLIFNCLPSTLTVTSWRPDLKLTLLVKKLTCRPALLISDRTFHQLSYGGLRRVTSNQLVCIIQGILLAWICSILEDSKLEPFISSGLLGCQVRFLSPKELPCFSQPSTLLYVIERNFKLSKPMPHSHSFTFVSISLCLITIVENEIVKLGQVEFPGKSPL